MLALIYDLFYLNIGQDMARALLTVEDVNVVIVDWRGGSLPLYSQAAANTRWQEC